MRDSLLTGAVKTLYATGNLVIDRVALARIVRTTHNVAGVSCSISIDPLTENRINDPNALARRAGDTGP